MRIGVITSSYPSGPEDSSNAGVFVRDFAWDLSQRGHDVLVISPHVSEPSPGQPFTVYRYPWPGTETSLAHISVRNVANMARLAILLLSGLRTCLSVLRKRDVEHVIAMWAVPSGILALAMRRMLGIPYSVWVLGSDIWKIGSYPLGKWVLRRVLRGARRLYADGVRLAEDVEAISGRPCDFLASSRVMPQHSDAPAPELAPGKVHVLCVARMHPHKGVDVLVDAISMMQADERSGFHFHFFGDGPERRRLELLSHERGLTENVSWGPTISKGTFMSYLRGADVLVVPSRIESIPLILTDAAQVSRPVIATDVGDMGFLVRKHGLGQVIEPENPGALVRALRRAREGTVGYDPAGARRMVEELSLARSVDRILVDMGV